jgi:hypothetical protein
MWSGYPATYIGLAVGDEVYHKQYTFYGKMKVTGINFGKATLERDNGEITYYDISDLLMWDNNVDFGTANVKEDPLYCTCTRAEAKVVESSTQVQGSVDSKDKFKFCRTCKKEVR